MAEQQMQPVFVLVRPQMGENIGGAARAMANFGLERLRLVSPRDGWPNPRAVAMASGAARLLDNAQLHDSTAGAVADCDYVLATTARSRALSKPVMTPERAMAQARALCRQGRRVGVLFGPERAGLENGDVALADAIVSVPVEPGFSSLNLAQCVLLNAYEWRRDAGTDAPEVMALAGTAFASKLEVQKLGDHFERRLEEAGFFFPPQKAEGMKLNLRNMWGRLALTGADVRMLHGVLRQLLRNRG